MEYAIKDKIDNMTETQVRKALYDLVFSCVYDPEALTVDTEMIASALELHGLDIYGEDYEDEDDE